MKLNLRENTGDYIIHEFRERKNNVTTLILPQIKTKSMNSPFINSTFFHIPSLSLKKRPRKTLEDQDRQTDMKIQHKAIVVTKMWYWYRLINKHINITE